jgi:hypothetical protein
MIQHAILLSDLVLVFYPTTTNQIISLGAIMVFNATFNNISIISWLSVLLVEETGVPGENHDLP